MKRTDILTEIEREHEKRQRELTRILSAAAYVPPQGRWHRLLRRLGIR